MINFGILTVSTTCSQPGRDFEDKSGRKLAETIKTTFPNSQITYRNIVADNRKAIGDILRHVATSSMCDVLFTVGGTGFALTDVTPEATRDVIDKEATGLAYTLIAKSLEVTDMAMLSRPVCGIKNRTVIVNFPGSVKAALECFGFIKATLPHAVDLIRDQMEAVRTEHVLLEKGQSDSKVKINVGTSRLRHSPYPMLEVSAARDLISKILDEEREIEEIPINRAVTRILAEDIKAPNPIPNFPASIKDGYAVRIADGTGDRRVRNVMAAGDPPEKEKDLASGEIIRISTGAPIPSGSDAVVQIEDTTLIKASENGEQEEIVRINITPKLGQDIRQIGSDIPVNTVVLKRNNPIGPAYVGVMAMLGIAKAKVYKRLSIGIISTGNELIDFKQSLQPGQIYDSNKLTLLTLLKSYGYEAADCGIAKDNPNSIKSILETAFETNDLIVSSGGVSMSEFDLMKQVLLEDFQATIHVGRLNMKPGKPTVFGTIVYKNKTKYWFGLPGNPVSCYVTTLLLVVPALKSMENDQSFKGWPEIQVLLQHDIVNADSRPEYVRLKVFRSVDNQFLASSTGNQISSRLNSIVDANALLLVPGKCQHNEGALVSAQLFGQFI